MSTRVPSLLSCVLLLCLPAAAAGSTTTRKADLDGDGKPETITLQAPADMGPFTLKVGSATFTSPDKELQECRLEVVDLLREGDKWKEIAVSTGATDSEHRVFLFGFDGKAIRPLGEVHALGEMKGNGIVLAEIWMGFWNRTEKYVLDRATWTVRRVPQPFYYVGKQTQVKKPFALTHSRQDASVVANLAPGTSIEVLAADLPERPGGKVLYLVKSGTGLLGWIGHEELLADTDLPQAG
jgi:hypothetical protein